MNKILLPAAHIARVVLGCVFLAAGVLKSLDVAEFARQTAEYGIVGPGLAALAAPLLIALEVTLGVALIAGWRPRQVAVAAGSLLMFFIALEAWGLAHGRTEACGCFGAYLPRTPAQVIMEDLGFLTLAVVTWVGLGAWRAGGLLAPRLVAAAAALSLGFALASPRLPIDRLVTSLDVGASVEDLGIASHLPAAGEGPSLVVLIDVTAPDAKQTAEALNSLTETQGAPPVIGLTPSTEQEEAEFRWNAYPAFEIHPVDRPTLKRLYRRLPLYFLVQSGRVVRIFDDPRPPAPDLLSSEPS